MLLEVCIDSLASGINAEKGGAHRLEVCSNLAQGGLTPSTHLLSTVIKQVDLPIMMMVRPRSGDFVYKDSEIKMMQNSIALAKSLDLEGIVLGALTSTGEIDTKTLATLLRDRGTLSVTFHRAFDVCKHPMQTLRELEMLGVDRVLTSGMQENAIEGKEMIKRCIRNSRMTIMPGSGVLPSNLYELIKSTNATEYHGSFKKNPSLDVTDTETVMRAIEIMKECDRITS